MPSPDGAIQKRPRGRWGNIENLDDNIGRLLAELEDRELREETAVMFISDHGEMMGSHGLTAKQHPYEESVGVPFVVSYPDGDIADGRTIEEPTCTEDWYPTILGFAGLDADDKPGEDLSPLMSGEQSSLQRAGVLLEFVREVRPNRPYHEETWRGFRTERYKYTVRGDPQEGAEPWQLFDLAEDPYERCNLLDDDENEALARDMHSHLREALVQYGDDYALEPAFDQDALNLPTSPFDA